MPNSAASDQMDHIRVDRAISEIRSGRPVLIRAGQSLAVATIVENLDAARASWLETHAKRFSRLVLPAPRLRRLGFDRTDAGAIALPRIDLPRIETLSLQTGARFDAPVTALSKIDRAALELARLSLVLPAVVVTAVSKRSVAPRKNSPRP